MRRIDRLISLVMWGVIGMSVLIMAMLAQDRAYRTDWPYTTALCLLWVPPAFSLAWVDDIPGPQPPLFYRFALITLLYGVGIVAYGLFVFSPG